MAWLHWDWHAQFEAWQEVTFGLFMFIAGLGLEFAIDVWREKVLKRRKTAPPTGKTAKSVKIRIVPFARVNDADQRHIS